MPDDDATGPDVGVEPGVEVVRPSLRDILHTAVANGASDVHIRAGAPPLIRVSGDLWPLGLPELTPEDTEAIVLGAFPTEEERRTFAADHECDFALTEPGVGRFRVNAYRTRGTTAMVLRHVKEVIPSFEELGLPRVAHDLALRPTGLVLVCGPTGSGKTTTLAAMIDAINSERRCHVLTIEDPIEFLHVNRSSTISQRELHTDTREFGRALRSGMRQDPDVILIGEIRDPETMRTALQAAETGHLVLASLHARTIVDAVNRVIDIFPVDEQRQARASIAESLQGIMCQHLVGSRIRRRPDHGARGGDRHAAHPGGHRRRRTRRRRSRTSWPTASTTACAPSSRMPSGWSCPARSPSTRPRRSSRGRPTCTSRCDAPGSASSGAVLGHGGGDPAGARESTLDAVRELRWTHFGRSGRRPGDVSRWPACERGRTRSRARPRSSGCASGPSASPMN